MLEEILRLKLFNENVVTINIKLTIINNNK